MAVVGFEHVRQILALPVFPLEHTAQDGNYTAIHRLPDGTLAVPRGSSPAGGSVLRHLLFGVRYEHLNLQVLAHALRQLDPGELLAEIHQTPNGAYVRKLCYLYETFTGNRLETETPIGGNYVPLFDPELHITGPTVRVHRWRLDFNGLGDVRYCPVVRKTSAIVDLLDRDILQQARNFARDVGDALLDRALAWAYLSETHKSFEIEREAPDASKAERFVELLKQAHQRRPLTEEYLVELQNSTVSNPLERATQFRTEQNWLHNGAHGAVGVTYVPPPPDAVPDLMQAIMDLGNRPPAQVDPLIVAALISFGFVFVHPFMDGNGRLSRFLVHQSLCVSGQIPDGFLLPVSIAMKNAENEYLAALQSFSRPARQLWQVMWLGDTNYEFQFRSSIDIYRYWDATDAVHFLLRMAEKSMSTYLHEETQYLQAFDQAHRQVNETYDIRGASLATLLRACFQNGGRLSKHRRKQFSDHVPPEAFELIEAAVQQARETFGLGAIQDVAL